MSNVILNRDNQVVEEQIRTVEKECNGITFSYVEYYYLDYPVNEDTGNVNKTNGTVPHYTNSQVSRNLKLLTEAVKK